MNEVANRAVTGDVLTAGINYALNTGEKFVNETFGPNNIRRRTSGSYETRMMPVRDGRACSGELSL
jgi:hypothetical protein